MAFDLLRGHAALRRGRFSQPGGEYFITICTDCRKTGLAEPRVATTILDQAQQMSTDGTWTLRCMVVMRDHIHLLMILGARLSLGRTVRRLKAKTSAALRSANVEWERDLFDRLLRPNDDRLSVFLYIYLNPYRAGLVAPTATWPYYYCRPEDWLWFSPLLMEQRPMPEWLL